MPRYAITPPLTGSSGEAVVFGGVGALPTDTILLGRLHEGGPLRRVEMDVSSEMVLAVFGKRGSGKSFSLGVIAESLCTRPVSTDIGVNTHQKGALLFDTLNVFWSTENPFSTEQDAVRFPAEIASLNAWRLTPPELDVEVWIPAGFRNSYTPSHYRDFAIATAELTADDLTDLFDVDAQRDPMGQLLAEVRDKAASRSTTYSFRDMLDLLENDDEVREYYADGTIRAARQRLRAMSQIPLFSSTEGTPLSQLLVRGRLAVLELGEVPNSLRTVIASVVLRRIHSERARASDAEKQLALNTRLTNEERGAIREYLSSTIPPSWVLIDEAQNILPGERAVKSSDAVVRFVREGRNFGLSLAFTTQQPAAVDQRILAQTDTVICHKLTVAGDIARVRDNLKCSEPIEVRSGGRSLELGDWLRSLDRGEAIVTNAEFDRVFALQFRPRVCPHGGAGFRAVVEG
jgi:uncharacterized protein